MAPTPSASAIATVSNSTIVIANGWRRPAWWSPASRWTIWSRSSNCRRRSIPGSWLASSTRNSPPPRAMATRCSTASCAPRVNTRPCAMRRGLRRRRRGEAFGGYDDRSPCRSRPARSASLLFSGDHSRASAPPHLSGRPAMNLCGFEVGLDKPFFLIAGPCVVESEQLQVDTAGTLKDITSRLGIHFIFKSSFDKANRTSSKSFRGLGLEEGLRILGEVKKQVGVPVLTDVHEYTPFDEVAKVVDVLQTPAFLCRQTDFIQKVAAVGKPVNIKKGQFLSPWDMKNVVEKARAVGNEQILVCERGASFGYNNLVSDMRSLAVMRETGCPVVFDATHSVQLPGGQGTKSGGQREFVPVLARAAVAVGVSGVFMETHPDPSKALSDGPNAWPLPLMRELLATLKDIDALVKKQGFAEATLR